MQRYIPADRNHFAYNFVRTGTEIALSGLTLGLSGAPVIAVRGAQLAHSACRSLMRPNVLPRTLPQMNKMASMSRVASHNRGLTFCIAEIMMLVFTEYLHVRYQIPA